ncbi:MAG: hypothetical protein ETSY1_38890 [Candidatus Entotheonella factor]|uniref:Uncharacterized protein n=1 Tax=Entotheonella factor TaxID=1429438 RepID=W4L6J5_ENTF1|nr:MAG: hypothetical protein ETSY1_38890 [Candidatus Entotheonella factor]
MAPNKALTLHISDELAQELQAANESFLVELLERGLKSMKIDRALEQYAGGGVSFGAAARQAGVSQSEFARHAYARGMEPPFSDDTLAEELN